MKARLTQIEAKRRGRSIALGAEELRVGRDPDSDLVLEGVRASRLHALLRPLGDRHTVTDTGSTNGTTVNGVALARTPVLLENGDLIEFSGEFTYLYETSPSSGTQRWLLAACVMVALLLVSSAVAFWRLVLHQPILDQATVLALEGQEAGERGDLSVANARLNEAARLLIRNGYLDHVERAELFPAAMERLEQELGGEAHLVELLSSAQAEQQRRADAVIVEAASPDLAPAAGAIGNPRAPTTQLDAEAEAAGASADSGQEAVAREGQGESASVDPEP